MSKRNKGTKEPIVEEPTKSTSKRNAKRQKTGEGASPKRGWASWSAEEKERFFNSLKEFGRDFDRVTEKVGSKNYEQVRHFYYRCLKKINALVKPETIDKKDQKELLNCLLAYWDLKKRFAQKDEYTEQFAAAMRDALKQSRTGVLNYEVKAVKSDYDDVSPKIASSRRNKKKNSDNSPTLESVDSTGSASTSPLQFGNSPTTLFSQNGYTATSLPSPTLLTMTPITSTTTTTTTTTTSPKYSGLIGLEMTPNLTQENLTLTGTPEKLTIQLIPRSKDIGDALDRANQNPRLQLSLKSSKTVAYVVNYLSKKWSGIVRDTIRLYPLKSILPQHAGWGPEDDITCLNIYHIMGTPNVLKLEYSWADPKLVVQTVNYVSTEHHAPKILVAPKPPLDFSKALEDIKRHAEKQPVISVPQTTSISNNNFNQFSFPLDNFAVPSTPSNVLNTDDKSQDETFNIKSLLNTEASNEIPESPLGLSLATIESLPTVSLSPLKVVGTLTENENSNSLPSSLDLQKFLQGNVNNNNINGSLSSPATPSKFLHHSGTGTPSEISLYADLSSDGFGLQDRNDEILAKTHYKYFESTDPSILDQQSADSLLGGNTGGKSARRELNFRNYF